VQGVSHWTHHFFLIYSSEASNCFFLLDFYTNSCVPFWKKLIDIIDNYLFEIPIWNVKVLHPLLASVVCSKRK